MSAAEPHTDAPRPDQAATDLALSGGLARRSRTASAWYATYMTAFGVGFAMMTLVIGLGPENPTFAVGALAVWAVFIVAALVWAGRRPVSPTAPVRAIVPGWVGSGVLYAIALFVGLAWFSHPLQWLAAAVVVSLPLLVGAHRLRSTLA